MISSALTTLSPIQHPSLSLRPPLIYRPSSSSSSLIYHSVSVEQRHRDRTICRADLSGDAPFAAAIGACVLSSLLFPAPGAEEDDGHGGRADSVLDTDDSRLIVMSLISFIPYFNWLSWIFAWLDTGKRRYAVYSLVYLIPYIRSNLSLSTDESWLPVASIILCVLHVQLETSIKNGDIQGYQLFSKSSKRASSSSSGNSPTKISRRNSEKKEKDKRKNLLSADEHSRNEVRGRGVPEDSHDGEQIDTDLEGNKKKKN